MNDLSEISNLLGAPSVSPVERAIEEIQRLMSPPVRSNEGESVVVRRVILTNGTGQRQGSIHGELEQYPY